MTTATLPPPAPVAPAVVTLADLVERLGGIPLERIRFSPRIGTATVQDVIDIGDREKKRCELIGGVLVEKAMGWNESLLAGYILTLLNQVVLSRNLGFVTGEAGAIQLMAGLVRIPDVAFVSWSRLPGGQRPTTRVPNLVPDLCVEVLSESNTAQEMLAKRDDYFASGVSVVWQIDPEQRVVTVFTPPGSPLTLTEQDTLDGGSVLPGFSVPLAEVFGLLDRKP